MATETDLPVRQAHDGSELPLPQHSHLLHLCPSVAPNLIIDSIKQGHSNRQQHTFLSSMPSPTALPLQQQATAHLLLQHAHHGSSLPAPQLPRLQHLRPKGGAVRKVAAVAEAAAPPGAGAGAQGGAWAQGRRLAIVCKEDCLPLLVTPVIGVLRFNVWLKISRSLRGHRAGPQPWSVRESPVDGVVGASYRNSMELPY